MANMDVKHQSWSYFGLPYQDHNYGAPPPRTPPISPGRSGSSAAAVGCVVLDKMVPDISQVKREEIIVESDLLDSSSSFPVVGSTVNIESTSAAESLPAHGHNSSAPTNHSAHSPPANPRQRHRTSSGSALSIAPASVTASKKARVSSGHRNSVKNNSTLSSTGYSSSASSSLQRASARSSLDKHPSKRHPETRASEGSYDNSVTRCVCDLQHDDGYMICCDHCMVWQHIDCMGVDRDRIPENYFCERCDPRPVDKQRAVELQKRKVAEMSSSSDGSSSDDDAETANANGKKRLSVQQRTRKGDKLHRKKNGIKRAIHKQSKQKEQLPPKRRLSSTMKNSRAKGKDVEEEVDEVDANDMCENGSLSSEYEYIKENIYSPEVLRLTSKLNGQHTIDFHILRQIQPRSHLIEVDTERRSLIARENMEPHQLIAEYRGEILVAEDFDDLDIDDSLIYRYCNYKGTEIFIDTRTYGNESRYIQRSTTPNGEVQHFVDNGKIFFLIYSTRFIGKGEEITLAFNHANCCDEPSKKALGADSPIEERPSQKCAGSVDVDDQSPNEISSPGLDSQDKPKQLSREERKIEAIMKMFERLEKEQQRKQTTDKRRGRSDSGEEKPLSPENLPEQHSLTQSRTLVNRRVSTNSRGRRGRHSSSSRRQGRTRSNSIISNSGSEVTTRSDSSVDVEMPSGTVLHGRELTSTPIADGTGFKLPKTKKHLMNEWLSNEGVATPPSPDKVVDRPLTVRTADEENFVHFVRYSSSPKFSGLDLLRRATQPSPLSPHVVTPTAGSAADSSSAAKKRWLRQAMHSEVASERETPSVSNETSPSPSPVDYVTPLKKRRLARESVDISSTVSMSTESSCEEVPGDKPEMVCSGQLPHEELFAMELTANPSYPECASSAVDSNTPDRDLPASVSEVSNSISQPLLSVCERLLPACLGRSGEPSATVEMVSESVGTTSTSNGAAERSATVDQILPDASADDEFDRSTVNAAPPPPVDSAYISESDSALVAQSGGDTTPLMDEGVVTSAVADGEEVCGGECDSSSRGIDYVPVESYCLELSPDDQDERETEPTSSMVEAADSCGEPGPCSSSTDVCSQPSHDTRFHPKKKLMSLADWPSSGDAEMVTSSSGEAAAAASESRHSPLAATKKKMSLEEYRRRVRDRPSTDEPADSTRPSKSTDADNASLPSLEDLPPPPPPPPPEGASPDVKKKWAAFPGMERKYESLAERLRREFSVDIDEEAEREKKALAAQLPFGGILSMSVPGSIPVPLAQPIMFMGNHHLPLDHHSPSSQALPYSPREVHSTTPPSGPATSRFSRQSSADASGMLPSYSNGPNGSHQYRYSPYSQSKEVQPSRPHSYQSKPNSVGPFRRNSHKW